jgi:hypothetical protein
MNDLKASQRGREVVIGASMAGLLTADVLSEHFDEVEIIDRDRLPYGPEEFSGREGSRSRGSFAAVSFEPIPRRPIVGV